MSRYSSQFPFAVGLLVCSLLHGPRAGAVQSSCPADIVADGQVTAADVAAVIRGVEGDTDGDLTLIGKADLNGDQRATAADVVMVVRALGLPCSNSTPTATRTSATASPTPTASSLTPGSTATPISPTATRTVTPTPSATRTRPPTATATMVCPPQAVPVGSTPVNGELTTGSCRRYLDGKQRYTNVYSVVGTPGNAIKIEVDALGGPPGITPLISVADADGQFGLEGTGASPVVFYVTTPQPYEFMVSSSSAVELGPYTLTMTQQTCPTPVALPFPTPYAKSGLNLLDSDCPDPGAPSVGPSTNPADIYTFTVTQVPANVQIIMQQTNANDNLLATLSVRGPNQIAGGTWYNGIEIVTSDLFTDCSSPTGNTSCAEVRFLALERGTYAIVASGGTGAYSLSVSSPTCSPTALDNIPSTSFLQCSSGHGGCACTQQSGFETTNACGGTFTPSTACAAPPPDISLGEPEDVASPSDIYTFTATAGDVISVLMSSDDDAHLYLLGPGPDNPLIAQDDNSGAGDSVVSNDAELAATLVKSGTYTIVAANNRMIDPGPPPAPVSYTLFLQKCGVSKLIHGGQVVTDSFSTSECVGYGGIPYRSYAFNGSPGQFLSASVSSDAVDAYVRIFGPNGSVVENDTDPFATTNTDARASRVLQQDSTAGSYFIEVSSNVDAGKVDATTQPPPGFTLQVLTCPAIPAVPGAINGVFGPSSCTLPTGQKFSVYTFTPPAAPAVASILPPSNGCVLNLLAEGPQTPDNGCGAQISDMPLMSTGIYGFMVAADDPATLGPYTAQLRRCNTLAKATFGDVIPGSLAAGACVGADGAPANWFFVHGPYDLVEFNLPLSGALSASFPFQGVLVDIPGTRAISGGYADDLGPPSPMFQYAVPPATTPPPLGGDVGFLVKIQGATPADGGPYTLEVDPASFR